jgi:hypothetical protein
VNALSFTTLQAFDATGQSTPKCRLAVALNTHQIFPEK